MRLLPMRQPHIGLARIGTLQDQLRGRVAMDGEMQLVLHLVLPAP